MVVGDMAFNRIDLQYNEIEKFDIPSYFIIHSSCFPPSTDMYAYSKGRHEYEIYTTYAWSIQTDQISSMVTRCRILYDMMSMKILNED